MDWLNEAFVCIRNDLSEFAEQLQEDSAEFSRQLEETFFNENWGEEHKESLEKRAAEKSNALSYATTPSSPTTGILSAVNSTYNETSISVDSSTTVTVFENYVFTSSPAAVSTAQTQSTNTSATTETSDNQDTESNVTTACVNSSVDNTEQSNLPSSSMWDELEASSTEEEEWELV
eukprot:gb/GECG01009599.1/.p1 GENE.gb/GECG01009599.1/~~gb/GECG01009599.1/.p1  ORF type:complete len:176 (+),score=43.43 gb/GECG01009599.1/:1-528(+)